MNDVLTSMRAELRLLLTAVQYFTRLPVPAWVGHSAAQLDGSARYFPLIGTGVGGVGAAVLWGAQSVLPTWAAAILSTAVTMGLTGAFHEDGLADTFDGLGATGNRERALQIMKDSRIGTFGVLALTIVVLLKIGALASLPTQVAVPALIAGHAVSRWYAIVAMWRMRYVREEDSSRAKPLVRQLGAVELCVAAVFGIAPSMLLGWSATAGIAAALFAFWVLSRWVLRRIGGYTGDTLGATQQVTEVVFYVGVLGTWTYF